MPYSPYRLANTGKTIHSGRVFNPGTHRAAVVAVDDALAELEG